MRISDWSSDVFSSDLAAHIRPVVSQGPDSVRNGLALSGTIHWMFDRGLISIDDGYSILTAQGRVPDKLERLIRPERCIARSGERRVGQECVRTGRSRWESDD